MARFEIRKSDPTSDTAQLLLRASTQSMKSLYPDDWCHVLSVDELSAPEVMFFLGYSDGIAIACGALASRTGYAEVKSMYVAPDGRGLGMGRGMLDKILGEAKAQGHTIARLETGYDLKAAVELYRSAGFEKCPAFGGYPDVAASLFMECSL